MWTRVNDLPLECLNFPIKSRFTEQFWRLSNYFFALADRQNDYLIILFTRDVSPYRIYQKFEPLYFQFGFLHPTRKDVNNQTHKVNRTKMFHKIHYYIFVQHHFHWNNPIVHIKSRLRYVITKLTSPFYKKYTYNTSPKYCKEYSGISTLSRIISCFHHFKRKRIARYLKQLIISSVLRMSHKVYVWASFQPPLQGLDGGHAGQSGTDTRGDTDPQLFFLALQPHCNIDLYRAIAACLARDKEIFEFIRDSDNRAPDFEFEFRTLATALPHRAH